MSMKNELRISMAMGGGVSLGTFSGGALTEAVKLLLLDTYLNRKARRVVIDSFSGASAGGMALGILLRALSAPPPDLFVEGSELHSSMIELLEKDFSPDKLQNIRTRLDAFSNEFPDSSAPSDSDGGNPHANANSRPPFSAWNELLAITYAQSLEHKAWVKEVNIARLTRHGDPNRPDDEPALLFRRTTEEIAGTILKLPEGGPTQLYSNRLLLGDRVLYGLTLTNLSPLVLDARHEMRRRVDETGLIGLKDPLRSFYHRDMRIFDVNFTDMLADDSPLMNPSPYADTNGNNTNENISDTLRRNQHPHRWYRFHLGERATNEHQILENFATNDAWQTIAATAIACGCFPIAFRPVILERHRCEYVNNTWPKQLAKLENFPEWSRLRSHTYPFTYVDGGTFNNEPLREAFRLAYFLDNRNKDTNYTRKVLFVDPILGPKVADLGLGIYNNISAEENERSFSMKKSGRRIFDVALSVGGAIKNQARVNEADKVFQKRDEFELRKKYRKNLIHVEYGNANGSDGAEALRNAVKQLARECKEELEKKLVTDQLASVQTTLQYEMNRIINEVISHGLAGNDNDAYSSLLDKTEDFVKWAIGDENMQLEDGELAKWYRLLMLSNLDIMMDMEGVDEKATILSISPFRVEKVQLVGEDEHSYKFHPLNLQGAGMAAFAGFFAETARETDFNIGKWAALHFLKHDEEFYRNSVFIRDFDPNYTLPDEDLDYSEFEDEYLEQIVGRISNLTEGVDLSAKYKAIGAGVLLVGPLVLLLQSVGLSTVAGRAMLRNRLRKKLREAVKPKDDTPIIQFRLVANKRFSILYPQDYDLDGENFIRRTRNVAVRVWRFAMRPIVSSTPPRMIKSVLDRCDNDFTCDSNTEIAVLASKMDSNNYWTSRHVMENKIMLEVRNGPRLLIPLPDPDYIKAMNNVFTMHFTLDLRPFENLPQNTEISDPEWHGGFNLYPTDDARVFSHSA